ncbi:hypothetical protein KM043_002602 [Ampulex compressa]|nr:hypothetical protein KM043_002602 [Ampulex compressa]
MEADETRSGSTSASTLPRTYQVRPVADQQRARRKDPRSQARRKSCERVFCFLILPTAERCTGFSGEDSGGRSLDTSCQDVVPSKSGELCHPRGPGRSQSHWSGVLGEADLQSNENKPKDVDQDLIPVHPMKLPPPATPQGHPNSADLSSPRRLSHRFHPLVIFLASPPRRALVSNELSSAGKTERRLLCPPMRVSGDKREADRRLHVARRWPQRARRCSR